MKVNVKPLSINKAFRGRRFKTNDYKQYEIEVASKLIYFELPEESLLDLEITVGFSSKGSDIDNVAKPFIDILQKFYGFNDSRIYKLTMNKTIVKKGEEFIMFTFKEL